MHKKYRLGPDTIFSKFFVTVQSQWRIYLNLVFHQDKPPPGILKLNLDEIVFWSIRKQIGFEIVFKTN